MISIVTPSLNQSKWLRLAVASVADQKGVTVEHIVQDANSDDGTRDWLARDKRVRSFFESDQGMYDAINRGLARAGGDVCAYLNCDEQYLPGALATVAKFFDSRPAVELLFADVILVDKRGEPISYRRSILPTQRHLRVAHLNTSTCATFFRRRLLERGFYFDPHWKAIGDAVWIDRLLSANVRMAMLPKPVSVFAFTGENLGASTVSRTEGETWHRQLGKASQGFRSEIVWIHRLKKMMAGAYWPRRVEIDIFTLQSPEKRQHFTRKGIGFYWPGLD
ncbi:MAG TPA: glycosyltransferase [Chthoniobacterales bacterium]|jgi:glycosyltransferase involved in cell wall biosynthesis